MNGAYWRGLVRQLSADLLSTGLLSIGLLSTGLAAAEPPATSDEEPSLEMLEFLADYGTDSGELDLPAELDAVASVLSDAPTRDQTTTPVTTATPTGKGDQTP